MTRLLAAAVAAAALVPGSALAAAPPVDARAYLVVNGGTGEVLAAHQPRARLSIASITKLMTVLIALERSDLSDVATVQADVTAIGESSVNLRAGERLTVRDLVEASLIQSANDAAETLADHVAGDETRFATLMNRKARQLGMTDSRFVRPDGLDTGGHYSSARDVTRLAREIMRDRVVRSIVRRRTDTIAGGRTLYTWNDLLGEFPGLFGVKTGHTSGAGWCEVGAARRNGATIYATILGSPTRSVRNRDLARLLGWGLAQYRLSWVIEPKRVYARLGMPYGRTGVDLVAAQPRRRALRLGRGLLERVVVPDRVPLPVRKGQRLGEVRVYERGRLIGRSPLLATRAVNEPGFLGKAGWYSRRTLARIGGWFR